MMYSVGRNILFPFVLGRVFHSLPYGLWCGLLVPLAVLVTLLYLLFERPSRLV